MASSRINSKGALIALQQEWKVVTQIEAESRQTISFQKYPLSQHYNQENPQSRGMKSIQLQFLKLFILGVVCFDFMLFSGNAQEIKTIHLKRESEKQLKATLNLGAMSLSIRAFNSENIFEFQYSSYDTSILQHDYENRHLSESNNENEIAHLKIAQISKSNEDVFSIGEFLRSGSNSEEIQDLRLSLNDALPINLDMTLGGASADLNLSGLKLKKLALKSGACKTKIYFQKPNSETLESFRVASGASKIVMSGLGNANIENFNYAGGASNAVIDFSGEIMRDLTAKISVGAGSVTVYIPKNSNIIVRYEENFFSSVTLPDDFEPQDNFFTSTNRNTNAHTIDIQLSCGVGTVKVQWK
ncbi:MAG: hypothetical protein SFU91_02835 [Chloroherpetonaceae bacterium]|nr:hypothetical protein [Chloroherpetonaceae bacterium]